MTLTAARFGMPGTAGTKEAASRHLAALGRATEWHNSPPLPATSLLGKVVLVQFGTYSCINWLRTLPYVRAWNQKYRQELAVIGVTPPSSHAKRTSRTCVVPRGSCRSTTRWTSIDGALTGEWTIAIRRRS
jgi:hypothetical protein